MYRLLVSPKTKTNLGKGGWVGDLHEGKKKVYEAAPPEHDLRRFDESQPQSSLDEGGEAVMKGPGLHQLPPAFTPENTLYKCEWKANGKLHKTSHIFDPLYLLLMPELSNMSEPQPQLDRFVPKPTQSHYRPMARPTEPEAFRSGYSVGIAWQLGTSLPAPKPIPRNQKLRYTLP